MTTYFIILVWALLSVQGVLKIRTEKYRSIANVLTEMVSVGTWAQELGP